LRVLDIRFVHLDREFYMLLSCTGLKPRVASRDGNQTGTWTVRYFKNGIYQSTLAVHNGHTSIAEEDLIGYDHPNFHLRVKRGELLCKTPFWKTSRTGSVSGGYYVAHIVGPDTYESIGSGEFCRNGDSWARDLQTIYDSHIPELEKSLVQKAAAKIMSQSHDTLTFLAELTDIKKLFTGCVSKLLRLKLPEKVTDVTNLWLEARYAWRTTIMDLQSLNDAIMRLGDEQKKRYSKSARTVYEDSIASYTPYSDASGEFSTEMVDELKIEQVGSVTADISIPEFSFNPVVTAWEIVPYSFVIDWLLNVGQAIIAASFLTLNQHYAASIGYKVTMITTKSYSVINWNPSYSGGVDWQGSCTNVVKYRHPCEVPYTPYPRFAINLSKIMDLLSMLAQLRR
jgi:hypothetical protein